MNNEASPVQFIMNCTGDIDCKTTVYQPTLSSLFISAKPS